MVYTVDIERKVAEQGYFLAIDTGFILVELFMVKITCIYHVMSHESCQIHSKEVIHTTHKGKSY